ncbi:MAG: N-glycosylase/DNA lyase [Candidatus Omnitrophica bacterium]|nr:N-glycosylase/DNA lyase [Candidatus Omnitrophota bacterium]
MTRLKHLLSEYRRKKPLIRKRLREFRQAFKKNERAIFEELCFCILTPQSKAFNCDRAVKELARMDLLHAGDAEAIRDVLRRLVRFHNNKASYIVGARGALNVGGCGSLKRLLRTHTPFDAREWLVENVKGLGYKESSHFLRNIGLGKDLAILDRHILKNLKRYGAISHVPFSLNRKAYLEIEEEMKRFCGKISIPLEELDLLFWSQETGAIFK